MSSESSPGGPQLSSVIANAAVRLPFIWRRILLVFWDGLAWVLALLSFALVRYDFVLKPAQWTWAFAYTGLAVVLQLALGLLTHVYLGRSRVGSFSEATWMGGLVLLVTVPLGLMMTIISPHFPRGVAIMLPPLALMYMAAARWIFRIIITNHKKSSAQNATPALVYGAGEAGHQVALLVDQAEEPPYSVVGFIDDDHAKKFLRVRGYRVLGTGGDLVRVARERGAEIVILAISDASAELMQRVSKQCRVNGIELVVIPPVREMIGGQVTLGGLREFKVDDLLGRRPIETDVSAIAGYITGKTVLVTGAGGSIGSELARQVYRLGPSKLILLDRDESELHSVQLSIYGSGLLDTDDIVLCDIRDYEALKAVFTAHEPEVVFHAAALKHLPMLERFPLEGWKTNVLGTRNVLRCAKEAGVGHLVNISTDKAADATSVLGLTKRCAERLTAWYASQFGLRYLSVRFGNVLGSRGSVLFTFRAQIERGGPVTVTHPDVTRYFMTIPEACQLVLQAGAIGRPGDVLVLDMGEPVRIVDVAERMIAESKKDIEIHYTGLRAGEKLHEVLFSGREQGAPSEHPLISGVRVPPLAPAMLPDKPRNRAELLELLGNEGASTRESGRPSHEISYRRVAAQ